MKWVHTSIIATAVFFLSAGISFGAEMDDLDITIRMVESDDLTEMHNELSLPDAASDTAREHAENEDGRGLTRANEVREMEHGKDEAGHDDDENHDEARDEREDEIEDHDEAREDDDDVNEEHDEANEEEDHEEEHEREDDGKTDPSDDNSTNGGV